MNALKEDLKTKCRRLVRGLLAHDSVAKSLEATAGRALNYLRIQRAEALRDAIEGRWLPIILETTPNASPFAALNYKSSLAFGSAVYPKQTGTYESELHDNFLRLLSAKYERVVDVGAAEGFYAVGLAKLLAGVPMIAYDISARARRSCRELAEINGVAAQVVIREYCDSRELVALCQGARCLVICDCEGFERFLFDSESVGACRHSALVVEVHDCFYPGIGEKLSQLFSATHTVRKVAAVDGPEKKKLLSTEARRRVPAGILDAVVDEHRPPGMYWLIFEPKP